MVVAICEDDRQQVEIVHCLIDKYSSLRPGLELSHHDFLSADKLLKSLEGGQTFDLYLLDILMPDVNGIELANEIRRRGVESPIVFLTSSADYALDAFNVSAMQYLLKPIKEDALFSTLDKTIALLATKSKEEKMLMVFMSDKTVRIPYSSIVCIENVNRTVLVYLTDGTQLYSKTFRGSFESAVEPLLDDVRFLQVHKSYILNLNHVEELADCSFIMSDGMTIRVPRYKFADMKNRYFAYLSDKERGLLETT